MITAENILLVGSILIFTSILISKTGYRFGIPTLLLFLLVGMAFGSDGLGIQFNSASDAQFIGMMALSIILFSGGMDTRYAEYQTSLKTRYTALYCGSIGHHTAYRIVYFLPFALHACQHRTYSDGFFAACCNHVVYRLGFGIQLVALTTHEP